jgi:spermidine/putrescine transport system substrate-binding protein
MGFGRSPRGEIELLLSEAQGGMTRADLLRRAVQVGAGASTLSLLLAACGDDDDDAPAAAAETTSTAPPSPEELSGTAILFSYPDWIGKNEFANFTKRYPNAEVKEASGSPGSVAAVAQEIQRDPDAFDFVLLGKAGVPQLEASDLIAEIDWARIPNIKNIPDTFREEYPAGLPTDYGKIGYAYRKDLVSERPTSWAEFYDLAEKYSGKVVLVDVMEDTIGNALLSLGFDGNTEDTGELEQARDLLIEVKPHLQAFASTDVTKSLVAGNAVMTSSWDFDIALAQQQEPNIEWVLPEEGIMAYIEGWIPVKGSPDLDVVYAFFDFHLEPENYADFINTTGSAYLMPSATPLIKKTISKNPILAFDEDAVEQVTFEAFKGDALEDWQRAWDEIKAA